MEEWVGQIWHRWITRRAERQYPAAAVRLSAMQRSLGVIFRALGGDPGLQIRPATALRHQARRTWLERVAGSGEKFMPASRSGMALQLPAEIAVFPDAALNRDLYVWLAAIAAFDVPADEPAFVRNQRASVVALNRLPGLKPRYARLVEACLAERPDPATLPPDEAAQERAIQQALQEPGSCRRLPALQRRHARPPCPVPLWLLPVAEPPAGAVRQHQASASDTVEESHAQPKQAKQTAGPDSEHGMLLLFRAESLFSWAEYVKVNRSQDDEPDGDAGAAADNLDQLDVMQDSLPVASRVRFELDLPPAGEDDERLGPGIWLPEWDYRKQALRADYCCVQNMAARDASPIALPSHLHAQVRRMRAQLAQLAPQRRWAHQQPAGPELDMDAWVRARSDQAAGCPLAQDNLYREQIQHERDLACLVLADLSLSTDASANDAQKVIDVIRDTLLVFGEALGETGDRFALSGFSSLKRGHVRYHLLKPFEAAYNHAVRGRINSIRPGYYTRLGAAIRHSTDLLGQQPNRQRLLLILSDGKPHDLDLYEGRYGIEDTRQSIQEARQKGIRPFCVTIDRDGGSYLPHMFGSHGYFLLRKVDELSKKLPEIYMQLTQG